MAYYRRNIESFNSSRTVNILGTRSVENYTVYIAGVSIGQYRWTVEHRYSEFFELHEKLVSDFKIDKHLLPPKKLFGNQTELFIKKRQAELEIYLQSILQHLTGAPAVLATFLDFDEYEIHGITQLLAEELYHKGDLILEAAEIFHINCLQLHAITTRLKLPEPTCDSGDAKKDLGHILDFLTRLKFLKIQGSKKPLGTSNIVMNELPYEMLCFKSLESLELENCASAKISGVDRIKETLKTLRVRNSAKALKDILLLDIGVGQWLGTDNESVLVPAWSALTSADFSHNQITSIDESVKLMAKVEYVDLSHNQLPDINQLENLSCLTHLDLSNNCIHSLTSLHTKLGNIKRLDLSCNQLQTLQGFSKLYSLESLDISKNEISQVLDIRHISKLPCLENLDLSGNPVTIVLDYRTKVLEVFGDRAAEVCLDKKKPTQKEIDTVAVLQAIQKSKETKEKVKRRSVKKPAVEAQIADSDSASSSQSAPDTDQPTTSLALDAVLCDPTALEETNTELYRAHVERIREQGGDAWLSLLNHMQNPRPASASVSQAEKPTLPEASSATGREHGQNSEYFEDADPEENVLHQYPIRDSGFMLPETLPGKNDSGFAAYLQVLLPNSQALSLQLGGTRDSHREERPVHITWCSVICYTNPYREYPACIHLTTENMHILEVTTLRNSVGFPDLEHIYCVPLLNIQQIVLGYQNLYIRIEEAFVGPQGTFTLLMANINKTDLFIDSLKLAYRRAIPDLDEYEDPHIVLNGETDLNLKSVLNRVEGQPRASKVEIRLYMLVNAADVTVLSRPYVTHALVMTSRYLYLLREDCILWPQPTFAIGPSTRPQFEIVYAFPIMGRITGIQMYDSDTYSANTESSISQTFTATNSSAMIVPNFIGFGVKLVFDMGSQGRKKFDVRVPTSGMRDTFLAALTQVRRETLDRSPSPAKVKTKVMIPEGDTDSLSSGNGSIGRRHRRHKNNPKAKHSEPRETVESVVKPIITEEAKDIVALTIPLPSPPLEPEVVVAEEASEELDGEVQRDSPTGESESSVESVAARKPEVATPAPPIPIIARPPTNLDIIYPTVQLLEHVARCNEHVPVQKILSAQMRNLAGMMGDEVINYFHSNVAQISTENEELRHLLWTTVTPYLCPSQEIPTCVMLSTRAVYLVSDDRVAYKEAASPHKTHSRHKSDTYTYVGKQQKKDSPHHMAGILLKTDDNGKRVMKSYHVLPLKKLKQVDIGFFDQTFRLSGDDADTVFSCVTRDNTLTESFIKELMAVLSLMQVTPSPDMMSCPESEQDFYKMFNTYGRSDSLEFTHPSRVKFIYPSEDSITELTYLIVESMSGQRPAMGAVHMLMYLLVFQVRNIQTGQQVDYSLGQPRTLIVSEQHIALVIEDHASYPLPEFSRGLPERERYKIKDVRNLEFLKRVIVSDFTSHDLLLVFSDESDDIMVDVTMDYYSPVTGSVSPSKTPVPEVIWTLVIQNLKDKDRLIKVISRQWSEVHEGKDLSVQVSA